MRIQLAHIGRFGDTVIDDNGCDCDSLDDQLAAERTDLIAPHRCNRVKLAVRAHLQRVGKPKEGRQMAEKRGLVRGISWMLKNGGNGRTCRAA